MSEYTGVSGVVVGTRGGCFEFALAYDLLLANTLFRKRESHLVNSIVDNTRAKSTLSLLGERIDVHA
jgi:hypothetical protein